MAEAPPTEIVEVPTPWGGRLKISGWNITLAAALMGLTWFTYISNQERSAEHDTLVCIVKLHLYISSLPNDKAIVWRDMPTDLYKCVPNFELKPGK